MTPIDLELDASTSVSTASLFSIHLQPEQLPTKARSRGGLSRGCGGDREALDGALGQPLHLQSASAHPDIPRCRSSSVDRKMCICGGVVVRARRDVVRADWGEGVGIWGGSGGGESAAFGT